MRWLRSHLVLTVVAIAVCAPLAAADRFFHSAVAAIDGDESDDVEPEESDGDIVALGFEEEADSEEPSSDPDAEPSLADEIRSLRDRLEELESTEKKRAADEKKKKETDAKKPAAKDDKPKENVWFDVSEEKWNIRMGGHVQMDMINWPYVDPAIVSPPANPPARDYFEFRRVRLTADGTGYGVYDFRLQMTLEPESTTLNGVTTVEPQVKDAYFSINDVPWLGRLRIGNFFVPFSLEQVTNDTFNIFLERSVPTQGIFTADREVGVATYNASADQNLSWYFGAFLDSISESLKQRIDNNQGYRLSGRLVWLPYYDEASDGRYLVHTGIGVLHTHDQDGQARFAARPQVRLSPFLVDSGVLNAGDNTTGNVELAIVMGRVTVQSEGFVCHVNLNGKDPVDLYGAYVHLSWFLTGESRFYERFSQHGAHFGRNKPFTNVFFTPSGCGLGAWEAKARYSNFSLDNLGRGRYDDLTLGFNWYWSDRTRVMFDYIHPITSRDSVYGSTQSDILGMRFDFNW